MKNDIKELRRLLKRISRQNAELARSVRAAQRKPLEIHNYFGNGSRARVYNGKVTNRLTRQTMKAKRKLLPAAPLPSDEQPSLPDIATLVARVDSVREYFWSDSAMAVIFCVCRDCYGYLNNMSQFERDFHCKEGLLSNAFRNNPYMRLHIDRWPQQAVKQRVLRLAEAYRKAVGEQQAA